MDIRTRQFLEKEIPNFKREIQALYRKFDKQFGLHGADVPMVFRYDEEVLGSYTPEGNGKKEQFFFSLFFISFCNKDAMHKADKIDLYAHEYAHYMQAHMDIPEEHLWQQGKHGSAWRYCCSLVGAAPTPYYRIGEGLKQHDYDKALYNPWADKTYVVADQYRTTQQTRKTMDGEARVRIGQTVTHPKYGEGVVEDVEELDASVRLVIRFGDEVRKIDQKWLLKNTAKQWGK